MPFGRPTDRAGRWGERCFLFSVCDVGAIKLFSVSVNPVMLLSWNDHSSSNATPAIHSLRGVLSAHYFFLVEKKNPNYNNEDRSLGFHKLKIITISHAEFPEEFQLGSRECNVSVMLRRQNAMCFVTLFQ